MRHTHLWLKPDFIFNFTKYAKEQVGLLDLIHGLTNNVSIAHNSIKLMSEFCFLNWFLLLGSYQKEGRILKKKEPIKRDT